MTEENGATDRQQSNEWDVIQKRLKADAENIEKPTVSKALHASIMSEVMSHDSPKEDTVISFNFIPYVMGLAACLCLAFTILINQEPEEPEIVAEILSMNEIPELVIEKVSVVSVYESEFEKLQADLDSGFQFLLSTVDLEGV